jgi:FtsP/CotA-like multicopper oxidase with cupredoxin domain
MRGYIGDTYITNGAIEPFIDLEAKEIRFRILNGANASVYELGFEDGRVFYQIATDNSFLERPVPLSRLKLSPGERAEIVVDLSGEKGNTLYFKDFRRNKNFLTLKIDQDPATQNSLPENLTSLEKFDPALAQKSRKFILSGRMGALMINGQTMDMHVINESVPLGQVEIWEVENSMGIEHNFHIHATHFMILERNGSSANVADNEKGYKDTVYLAGGDRVKLIVKMVDYKDQNNPYMYHCHFLEHEDAGMMGQFVVV